MEALWAAGVTQVAAWDNHSAALAVSGGVFTWGSSKYGQAGGALAVTDANLLLGRVVGRAG